MTREQLMKLKIKAYMQVDYQPNRKKDPIRCMLTGVNFDAELMTLYPLDQKKYDNDNFEANPKWCFIPIQKRRKTSIT